MAKWFGLCAQVLLAAGCGAGGGAPPADQSVLPDLSMGAGPTVMVGMGGIMFTPSSVQISVGQTVTWQWASGGHTVTSGSGGTADDTFCSPSDGNCAQAPTSNAGATYSHTFNQAGNFQYFCRPHGAAGMTGIIRVQ